MIAMNFGHGMKFGPESPYFPERFGPRVRYSGASSGFQLFAAEESCLDAVLLAVRHFHL
jgi:hypothetical protein